MVSAIGTLFDTDLELIVLVAMVILWNATELVLGAILTIRRRRSTTEKKAAKDRFSGLAVRSMLYISIIAAFLLALDGVAIMPGWLFYPGVLLTAAGIAVRLWSLLVLGLYFTPVISVQPGQKVVDRGPYRFIRHPSYLGILLTAMGIGLMLRSLAGSLVILVLCGLAIAYRIGIEERFLVAELGDEYVRYMKRTKRLIPFIV